MRYEYYLLLLICLASNLQAQDPRLSQYQTAPMVLNPALTGAFKDNNWRLNLNYRSQWTTFLRGGGYRTAFASLDGRFCIGGKDYIGAGVQTMRDGAGGFPLVRDAGALTGAYHKYLGKSSRSIRVGKDKRATINRFTYLSLGAEMGLINYHLSQGDFTFDEQFDNPATPDENFEHPSVWLPSGGIGIYFVNAESNRTGRAFRAGFAIKHINRPVFQFVNKGSSENTHLNPAITAHASLSVPLQKALYNRLSIEPSLMVFYQKPHLQVLVSSPVLLDLKNDNFIVRISPALRIVPRSTGGKSLESVVIGMQMDWSNFSFNFTYDLNCSPLLASSHSVGALECSGVFRFGNGNCSHVFCPFFER